MTRLLMVMVLCACSSDLVSKFTPQPKPPHYEYFSSLTQIKGQLPMLFIGRWTPDLIDGTEDIQFPLPWPCLPIPKELI